MLTTEIPANIPIMIALIIVLTGFIIINVPKSDRERKAEMMKKRYKK
jgi:hypothetical protein